MFIRKDGCMRTIAALPRLGDTLRDTLSRARAPLLFGLRLWASVCLALFVAFWLDLDNPFWAGISAAVMCQPQLGASLRKGWFRMVGTVIGATMVVVLTACFPQDRVAFLSLLALWGGLCVFVATLFRNFASYAASLAGYTAIIIAADVLGATGGPSDAVFMVAVWRATEICIGIACAGVVLAGTDPGGAPLRLAAALADVVADIMGGLSRRLALAGPDAIDTTQRGELVRRVIALDPAIDQALGESSQMRFHMPTLQSAVNGLFKALDGWREIAAQQNRHHDAIDWHDRETIRRALPSELGAASSARWMNDPIRQRRLCEKGMQTLLALPASTLSLRLLADETARVLDGLSKALDGLALLVDAPGTLHSGRRRFWPNVPDLLPPTVNAARAFLAIGTMELFWAVTGWPNGASAIVFVAIVILLLSPKGDHAYSGAIGLALGVAGAVICAAVMKFTVLPALDTFPAFCAGIGLFYVPVGFVIARVRKPAALAVLTGMASNFMPLLSPTNEMSYDTTQFYNTALAIIVGCSIAPLALRLIPPLSPALRAKRLLALSLRDLRRVGIDPVWASESWEVRMSGRLAALPEQAKPIQRARLLAALSVGNHVIQLRGVASSLGVAEELDAALRSFSAGRGVVTASRLHEIDRQLTAGSDNGAEEIVKVRARTRLLIVAETLVEHAPYFDEGAFA
jgi:uncharacterized membrane protein YccC